MDDAEIIARHGLPPREQDLPAIRDHLAEQTRLEAAGDGDTTILRAYAVLLFAAGHVEDAPRIWRAKRVRASTRASRSMSSCCAGPATPRPSRTRNPTPTRTRTSSTAPTPATSPTSIQRRSSPAIASITACPGSPLVARRTPTGRAGACARLRFSVSTGLLCTSRTAVAWIELASARAAPRRAAIDGQADDRRPPLRSAPTRRR